MGKAKLHRPKADRVTLHIFGIRTLPMVFDSRVDQLHRLF